MSTAYDLSNSPTKSSSASPNISTFSCFYMDVKLPEQHPTQSIKRCPDIVMTSKGFRPAFNSHIIVSVKQIRVLVVSLVYLKCLSVCLNRMESKFLLKLSQCYKSNYPSLYIKGTSQKGNESEWIRVIMVSYKRNKSRKKTSHKRSES